MFGLSINMLPLMVAFLLSFASGMLWYRLLGNLWVKAQGYKSPNEFQNAWQQKSKSKGVNPKLAQTYSYSAQIFYQLLAIIFTHAIYLSLGLLGIILLLLFVFFKSVANAGWSNESPMVTAINLGNELANFILYLLVFQFLGSAINL